MLEYMDDSGNICSYKYKYKYKYKYRNKVGQVVRDFQDGGMFESSVEFTGSAMFGDAMGKCICSQVIVIVI